MPLKRVLTILLAALAASLLQARVHVVAASKEKVLHSFGKPKTKDGTSPYAGLVFDTSGTNLYGTTAYGGAEGNGTVFELLPGSNGNWSEKLLHFFYKKEGSFVNAGVIFDGAGNLYGTTVQGGILGGCGGNGCGGVFELTPGANGTWTEKGLYQFTGGEDGAAPYASLLFDAAGNLYGTTAVGGNLSACSGHGCGVVFQLAPGTNGTWVETVLYKFMGGKDGYQPYASLISDSAGNLYGTTEFGGNLTACSGYGCGVVFQLTPGANGSWSEKVLHAFAGEDGAGPYAGLTFGTSGNLYGTTASGGNTSCGGNGCGTVFELTPGANGKWTNKVQYRFNGTNGQNPVAGLTLDKSGNLYGTASFGGNVSCNNGKGCGTVFKLTPRPHETWAGEVLHRFDGRYGDWPEAGLVLDPTGNLFGTTMVGGNYNNGIVFENHAAKLMPRSSTLVRKNRKFRCFAAKGRSRSCGPATAKTWAHFLPGRGQPALPSTGRTCGSQTTGTARLASCGPATARAWAHSRLGKGPTRSGWLLTERTCGLRMVSE
jgi:uncharacterized repeat protein (TIGR03803 family)